MSNRSGAVEDTLKYFHQRKAFAKGLAEQRGCDRQLCFALSGLFLEGEGYEFPAVAVLRKVEQPPGEIELAKALQHKGLLSAVARHMRSVTYELALAYDEDCFSQANMDMGWWLISALRTRSLADILVPAVADISWDIIPAMQADRCRVQLIEDVPRARRYGDKVTVTDSNLNWVRDHLTNWISLLEHPSFRLGVDALTTHSQHANLRMSAASLWSGFEALFSINAELRFRLALLTAAYLEERGTGRLDLFKRMKKLYDYRSKAVHGSPTTDGKLEEHIVEVRGLLSRLLCKMTEQGTVPSSEEFEAYLLT
ncbi:hypothetical protein IRZ53_08760 [Pseudomonas fulva]|nr:hypothetical protein [Pseudomonas fulva]MBF8696876.1 hypothetical protein [Pseudomonas fulva]